MIHFIVHGKNDTVGVVVTDVAVLQVLTGWNMETDETLEATAKQDIPLGHKIALSSVSSGEEIVKYNAAIGKATEEIHVGEHVHIHNLKTARW